jgi:hypothetical protein
MESDTFAIGIPTVIVLNAKRYSAVRLVEVYRCFDESLEDNFWRANVEERVSAMKRP